MNWREERLGNLVEDIVGGGTPSRKNPLFFQGDIPWASVKDLDSFDLRLTEEQITEEALHSSASNLIPAGNVIIATRVGLGKFAYNHIDTAINQDLKALIPNRKLVHPEYLLFFLVAHAGMIEQQGVGSTVKGVTLSQVRKWRVPLPPLPEQERIVALLRRAERLRQIRHGALKAADDLVPATFLELFGNPLSNPKGWPIRDLGELGEVNRGKSRHRPRDARHLYGGNYPFIQTGDVANADGWISEWSQTYSEAGLEQSRLWPVGTLCITIAANIAKTGILTFDACFPDSVVGFLPGPDVVTEYVWQVVEFYQRTLESGAPQAAQKNINLKTLRPLKVPLPPIELQQQFQGVLQDIRDVKANQAKALGWQDNLFQSLLTRAFTGELTENWREAHRHELATAATERDALLGVERVVPVQEPDAPRAITKPRRKQLLDTLTKDQHALLSLIRNAFQEERYVSAQSLAEEDEVDAQGWSLRDVHEALSLFEQAALIQRVRVEYTPADETYYVPAQRLLNEEQDEAHDLVKFLDPEAIA